MSNTETVTIKNANPAPQETLQESAERLGIDTTKIDPTAESQSVTKDELKPKEKILGKFNSQADLEKAYLELQKKMSSGKEEAPVEAADKKVEPEAKEQTDLDAAKEATEKAGLDFDNLSNKYFENGKLDDDDYDALEKASIPRHIVDQFIKAQEAQVELARLKVFNEVGGEDSYKDMANWAANALTEKELEKYNEAVNSDDMDEVIFAVRNLKARFVNANGQEPERVISGNTRVTTAETYASVAELTRDMADPRYSKDPAYRKRVEDKLSRSNIM